MKNLLLNCFALIFLLLASMHAHGESASSSIEVTATVEPSCTFTISNLNFGPYNFSESHETATLAVLCTNGTKFRIELGAGNGPAASDTNRSMVSNGKNSLKYALYQDKGMNRPWGASAANSLEGDGTGAMQHFKIYGRLDQNQRQPDGAYRDNVPVTLKISGSSGFGYQLSIGMTVVATIRSVKE